MQQRTRQQADRARTSDPSSNGLKQELLSLDKKSGPPPSCHGGVSCKENCSKDEIVQPRKLNGTSAEVPSYHNLHRELLLSHKRGLLLEEKPELKRVLEQRRLELHKEEEMAQRRPSDLEMELRKRQQKLEEYEQEEIKRRENQQKIPEFVRVKDNLRRTQTFEQ
ncbi:protein FAM107B isoform 2-T2 [Pholidichthys leucotaenia]